MKILTAFSLSICFSTILSTSIQAQTPSNTSTQKPPLSNDWKDFSGIKADFFKGCIGNQSLSTDKRNIKQNFCQCAFTSYQNRYTPQVFLNLNSLASKIGKDGPLLVSVMMQPELDACFIKTGYKP